MTSKLLTTGQAAAILSVTPDTVRKWIRSGRLPAQRTAGGHHRINRDSLKLVTTSATSTEDNLVARPPRTVEYCWEFYGNGSLPENCQGCIVYLTRAHRCYEVAKLAPESGHLMAFCEETCDECEFYRLVREQKTNVLVVTDNLDLAYGLKRDSVYAEFNLEIADCEYACSMKIADFRPDYAIVDCSLGHRGSVDISRHLSQDPRIPSVKVVLAGNNNEFPEECDKEIFARMEKPFGIQEINRVIDAMVKEDKKKSG